MAYYRDVEDDVARGLVNGSSVFGGFGKMVTAGPVTNQVIWPNGTWAIPPQTGFAPEIVSDDAADDKDAGIGVRSVEVHYVDTNYDEQRETVELEGLTAKAMIATDVVFIQFMHMVTYGSVKAAVGNITLREIGQTQAYSYISAGANRCKSSARMVPGGKRLLLRQGMGSSTSGTSAAITNLSIVATRFGTHDYIDDGVLIPYSNLGFQDNSFGIQLSPPMMFPEKTVVAMIATSDKAATISGMWSGILEGIPSSGT